MHCFIENQWQKHNENELGAMLGDMNLRMDGMTADPAMWPRWLECLQPFKQHDFSEEDGFFAMILFTEEYISTYYDPDIKDLLNLISACQQNKELNIQTWNTWIDCLQKTHFEKNYSEELYSDLKTYDAVDLFCKSYGGMIISKPIEQISHDMYIKADDTANNLNCWKNWLMCIQQCALPQNISEKEIMLNAQQSFVALRLYIQQYFEKTQLPDYELLLNELAVAENGYPQNPVMWEQWVDCFARLDNKQARMMLTAPDGIVYMP